MIASAQEIMIFGGVGGAHTTKNYYRLRTTNQTSDASSLKRDFAARGVKESGLSSGTPDLTATYDYNKMHKERLKRP